MEKEYIIEECPECGRGISVKKGKFVVHERGLAYMPYGLYYKICKGNKEKIKELAKRCKCKGSYKKFVK